MKALPTLILFSVAVVVLSCANGRRISGQPAFINQPAYFTSWTSGIEEGGSGFNLFIPVNKASAAELDSVYFRGRRAVLQKVKDEAGLYVARFRKPSADRNPEIVMHKDPRREYGNKSIPVVAPIPFELESDEAVVRYRLDGRIGYFKLTGIAEDPEAAPKIKNR